MIEQVFFEVKTYLEIMKKKTDENCLSSLPNVGVQQEDGAPPA